MNLQSMNRQDVPLHTEVAAVLRHQIMSGDQPCGTRLPAFRELTERFSGRGPFVKDVSIAKPQTLHMRSDISQILAMVSQLQVSVHANAATVETSSQDGRDYLCMKRIHTKDAKPFRVGEIRLDNALFELAPERFKTEIVVVVLNDLGIELASAQQKVKISYADFELASALGIPVNSAVFRMIRQFFGTDGQLIYAANWSYPGDMLALEIEFALDHQG